MRVAGQIPSITTASKLRFTEGNTIFDRTVGDIFSTIDVDLTSGVTGVLPVANGGTNLTTFAQGDIIYASASNTLSALTKNTSSTRYLSNTGSSNNPAWAQVNLTNGVTGTLPVANGGTGATTFTAGRVLFGNGTSAVATDANITWTDASDLLTIGGRQQINLATPTATQDGIRIANTVTSTTNNVTQYGIRSTAGLSNDGTPTGNGIAHYYANNTVSSPTKLSSFSGFNAHIINNSENTAAAYGMYGRLDEGSTGDLADRYGLRFDLYRTTNNTVTHTGYGVSANLADNSTSGKWSTGYGVNIGVTNAQTSYGVRATLLNNRGTTNTQRGLSIAQTTSGSGVVTDNAYGIELSHAESSSGSITNYYGIYSSSTPVATANYFLYASGSGWANYLNGGLSLGVDDAANGRLVVRGSGATSGTNTALFENSSGTDAFIVRDDGMSSFGTTPGSTTRLIVRGSSADTTATAFDAQRSSGTSVLKARNDGKVSVNNAAFQDALTVNGWTRTDGVVLTNQTGSQVSSGKIQYNNGSSGTYSGYLTIGDGTRQLAIMPTMIERHVVDYGVDWSIGRKGAFWTVPARFDGWKIAKAYIEVTSVGSGAGDDELTIEISGVGEGVQIVTAGTHTLVMDDVVNTDDVITFTITEISATPAKGLHVSLELSKN